MAVGKQNHGGIAVTVAGPLASGLLQPLDLLFGQVLLGRSSELGALRGTVRFTMVEGVDFRANFAMGFNRGLVSTVRKASTIRTVIKADRSSLSRGLIPTARSRRSDERGQGQDFDDRLHQDDRGEIF